MQDEHVILLHGLAETSFKMAAVAMSLSWEGYSVTNMDYPSALAPIEELTERFLAPVIKQHSQKDTLHFVTH